MKIELTKQEIGMIKSLVSNKLEEETDVAHEDAKMWGCPSSYTIDVINDLKKLLAKLGD